VKKELDDITLQTWLIDFWWRQLAVGRSLKFAHCRDDWGERSCPRSATAISSVAMDRKPNLPIGRRTLYHWAISSPNSVILQCYLQNKWTHRAN